MLHLSWSNTDCMKNYEGGRSMGMCLFKFCCLKNILDVCACACAWLRREQKCKNAKIIAKGYSRTGTRTRVTCVKGKCANHLHHTGEVIFTWHKVTICYLQYICTPSKPKHFSATHYPAYLLTLHKKQSSHHTVSLPCLWSHSYPSPRKCELQIRGWCVW